MFIFQWKQNAKSIISTEIEIAISGKVTYLCIFFIFYCTLCSPTVNRKFLVDLKALLIETVNSSFLHSSASLFQFITSSSKHL